MADGAGCLLDVISYNGESFMIWVLPVHCRSSVRLGEHREVDGRRAFCEGILQVAGVGVVTFFSMTCLVVTRAISCKYGVEVILLHV